MIKNNQMGFVEVSINSQRLCDFLSNIQKTMKEQQNRIEDINKSLVTKITEVKDDTQKISIEMKRNEKQIKQMVVNEVLIQKEQIRKTNQKTQQLFETLYDKVKSINAQMIQDRQVFQQVSQKAEYAFEECKEIKALRNTISNMEKEIGYIKSETFKKNLQQYIDKAHEEKVSEICQDTFFKIMENDRVRQIIHKKEYLSSESKPAKKPIIGQKQAMFYASISDKLDKLEQKLTQKNNIQLDKVLYPSKSPNAFNSSLNSSKFSTISMDQQKEELQQNAAFKGILSKIQNIELVIHKKIQDLKRQLTSQLEKDELFNQKIHILTKKLDKERVRLNDFSVQLKNSSQKKLDQRIIDSFRYEIRQKTIDYQDNLDSKVNKDHFQKQRNKINERIKIIHENLTQKTDKSQIKKAISFLQSKIKQIILLVAGSYDQDRQGSIKKTPFKCLSCNKDLDTKLLQLKEHCKKNVSGGQVDETFKGAKRSQSAIKLRCATSRMRKHIRINSGATTPMNNMQTTSFGFE